MPDVRLPSPPRLWAQPGKGMLLMPYMARTTRDIVLREIALIVEAYDALMRADPRSYWKDRRRDAINTYFELLQCQDAVYDQEIEYEQLRLRNATE